MSDILQKEISVLIVEDHELTRGGLVFAFKGEPGLKIVGEAENGEEGLRLVNLNHPDIVLMDINMPVMDGIEATRRIKEKYPDIKVVILTSHNNHEEVLASLAAGADAYCLKDIRTERLVQVLEMVMEGAIWLDPAIARHIVDSLNAPAALTPDGPSTQTRKRYNTELSERELQVLNLLAHGKGNKEIARKLAISIHTVKAHVSTIIQKLAVDDRTQAAVKALKEGLIEYHTQLES